MIVPYGYRRVNSEWQIEEDAAETVRRVFVDFCNVYSRPSLTEIAEALNIDGIRTARGAEWHASSVRYMLRNSTYLGDSSRPALVSPELFDMAQRRLDSLRPGPPV